MAQVQVDAEALALALGNAKTAKDVERITRMAEVLYGPLGRRPVGNRPNNSGTIRVASDPALGVVERVVNAMDALLDLGRAQHPDDAPTSPRQAAWLWYGVPKAGLADMLERQRRTLGENIQVWLDESGDEKRPTVVVQDRGIGQPAAAFPTTLVSLNEENKVAQSWNMGTYGQGGAVTFGFSDASIIVSRRHPKHRGADPDTVGWTIVRRVEDPAAQRLPNYQYLVTSSGTVPELDPSVVPWLEYGTRVVHVGYDLQGWTGPFTTGLWQFLHAALFGPVLPFLLTGKRAKEKNYGSRIVIGNAARLERPDKARGDLEIAHHDRVKFDLGARYGSVTFNYWVVRRPPGSESKADPAAGYVRADTAVSMTLFGQRQDTRPRSWIKDQAKLPFLYKGMVVQIDSDELTPVAKSEVFSSTRERATKSDMLSEIYDRLANVLRNDDDLKRLNYEEKERLLAKSTSAANEKVRRRLAKFIQTKLQSTAKPGKGSADPGTGGRRKYPPGGKSQRPTDDSMLPNVPSSLRFRNHYVRVHQGAGGYTWVEINAKNGYLPAHDDDLSFEWEGKDPGGKVKLTMRSQLLGGLSRWFFEADPDAPVDDYTFRATLYTPNGVLTDAITVTVAVPPEARPETKGTEPETGPDVRWVSRDEWPEHDGNLDARTAGYVTEDEAETIIWVNRHLDVLDDSLRSRELTPEQVDGRANRYLYPIACALWLQHHAVKSANPRPADGYLKQEMRRVAEAVLVAIDPDMAVLGEESEE